jgi:hypothetical protein
MAWAVRMIRAAISPRLATSNFWIMRTPPPRWRSSAAFATLLC